MSGAPGSGKTTLSRLLATSLNGVAIDHDLLKTFFLDSALPFDQSGRLTYRLQWVLAADFLRQGHRAVVVDSPCNFAEILDRGAAVAREHGCAYRYVECRVAVEDVALLDERIRGRAPLRSQRTGVARPPADSRVVQGADYDALFRKWIEHPARPESAIVVDSTRSPEESLAFVLKQIAEDSDG
ncbi:MAG TPA: AAA family ATPase [Candidatus Saccharimonadales bacterium]|jgi:predicted kinase|nr:AAA family ATPase [Candidatus Saccharimonadales bacterium]